MSFTVSRSSDTVKRKRQARQPPITVCLSVPAVDDLLKPMPETKVIAPHGRDGVGAEGGVRGHRWGKGYHAAVVKHVPCVEAVVSKAAVWSPKPEQFTVAEGSEASPEEVHAVDLTLSPPTPARQGGRKRKRRHKKQPWQATISFTDADD